MLVCRVSPTNLLVQWNTDNLHQTNLSIKISWTGSIYSNSWVLYRYFASVVFLHQVCWVMQSGAKIRITLYYSYNTETLEFPLYRVYCSCILQYNPLMLLLLLGFLLRLKRLSHCLNRVVFIPLCDVAQEFHPLYYYTTYNGYVGVGSHLPCLLCAHGRKLLFLCIGRIFLVFGMRREC